MAPALEIGVFIVPDATNGAATVEQIIEADRCGLDLVGVQDHPYQWHFFDTWTLLAYAAGRTQRVRLVPDVLNLPLRLPTLIAERAVNVMALAGEPAGWPDQLARLATELRFSTLLVTVPPDDPLAFVRRLGEDTAPEYASCSTDPGAPRSWHRGHRQKRIPFACSER